VAKSKQSSRPITSPSASDLDGDFGTEHTPSDLKASADLQKLDGLLAVPCYTTTDIDKIFRGNWL
jgi:hypothetical protein